MLKLETRSSSVDVLACALIPLIHLLSNHFKCNKDELVAEINLLQNHEIITKQIESNLGAKMLHIWLQWLKNYDKQNIFGQFTNILKK